MIVENILVNGSKEQKKSMLEQTVEDKLIRDERNIFEPGKTLEKLTSLCHDPDKGSTLTLNREVYSADNNANIPGRLVLQEGEKSSDPSVKDAYEHAGSVWKFYNDIFDRNSIDNKGLTLMSTVHYRRRYNNAFWDGRQMVYGDGDNNLFADLSQSLSVVAHELTHGVVQYSGGLTYSGESGALNESIADVFGAMTDQFVHKQTACDADWLMGKEIFTPAVEGDALRSLKEPGRAYNDPIVGKDPQPYHMKDFLYTQMDNGGVHTNSGIANHAFYNLSINLGGYSWEKAGKIWYRALMENNNMNASFVEFANLTADIADSLYGRRSLERYFVNMAWKEVGVF